MKKKIISLALAALCMGASLVGCYSYDDDDDEKGSKSSVSSKKDKDDDDDENEDKYIEDKLKIADSYAKITRNAMNSTLTDLDALGTDIFYTGWIDLSDWDWENVEEHSGAVLSAGTAEKLLAHGMQTYFSDISELDTVAVYIENGCCNGVYCSVDGEFWGTYPPELFTVEDHEEGRIDAQECIDRIEKAIK